MTIARYGLGYTPDSTKHRRLSRSSRYLLGSSPSAIPTTGSLESFEAPIMDQGQSGSCTGHGTSQACVIAAAANGRSLPFVPSPRILYAIVRELELVTSSDALTDIGAMPSDLITVVNRWGVAPIGFDSSCPTPDGRYSDIWTPDDVVGSQHANVNDKSTFLEKETAGLSLTLITARIDVSAPDFVDQVCLALANRFSVGFGLFVDTQNFMAYDGTKPISTIDTRDPQGGGHWIAGSSYDRSTATAVVGGPNSWNTGWGRKGHWDMTFSCLQTVCSDCLIFKVAS